MVYELLEERGYKVRKFDDVYVRRKYKGGDVWLGRYDSVEDIGEYKKGKIGKL